MSTRRKRKLRNKTEPKSKRIKLDVDIHDGTQWQCKQCTLINDINSLRCSICDALRPRNITLPQHIDTDNNKKKSKTKRKQAKVKRKKKKKKKAISYVQHTFEAIIAESISERDLRNGCTKGKIIKYIKQNYDENAETEDVIQCIKNGMDRGVLQIGINSGRYKITHLGRREYKKKGKKVYNINDLSEKQRKKEEKQNETKSKYNEKYYNAQHCLFDDEMDLNIIDTMKIEPLKKNLKFRGLKVGGNKNSLKDRLKSYIHNDKCRNATTFKQLKRNTKAINKDKFKYKCIQNLYDILVEINRGYMDVYIADDIWRFIAMYGAGIRTKCAECNEELYVMDGCKSNEKINDQYYILDKKYFDDTLGYGDKHKLKGRVFCSYCLDATNCTRCKNLLHPKERFYYGDACVKCDGYYCNACNDLYYNNEVDWCYRAGEACCNSCLEDLEDHEKEW